MLRAPSPSSQAPAVGSTDRSTRPGNGRAILVAVPDQAPPAAGALGEFLRSRRARVTPEAAGVRTYGRRRVPGLRREELAQIAGISVTYLTRLEQGASSNASRSVIDALARALDLDDAERAHLDDLAHPVPAQRRRRPRPDAARPGTLRLLEAMDGVPAVLLGRRNDVLAWNPLGHLLLAGHCDPTAPARPVDRPNLTRMLFLDPHTRDLFVHWDEEAGRSVATLRLIAGRHPDDRDLAELIGELTVKSDAFAALWSKHPVANCTWGVKRLHHPEVGELELGFEALELAGTDGHRLLTYTAERGSASAAALALLLRPA